MTMMVGIKSTAVNGIASMFYIIGTKDNLMTMINPLFK